MWCARTCAPAALQLVPHAGQLVLEATATPSRLRQLVQALVLGGVQEQLPEVLAARAADLAPAGQLDLRTAAGFMARMVLQLLAFWVRGHRRRGASRVATSTDRPGACASLPRYPPASLALPTLPAGNAG